MILCGDGGGRKSSLFRALADAVGPGLFRDTSFDLSDPKALVEQTAGSLFVELAELSSMRRARDVQAVKSALSGQVDRHRRPYAAMVEDCARAFTFVGSTNDETWITDPSGGQGRRFWPVATLSSKDKPMNLVALGAEAGQLFGEAVAAFLAGEQWFIDGDKPEHVAASKQWDVQLGARAVIGPWDEPLDLFLLQQNGPDGGVVWSLQEIAEGMSYSKAKEDDAAFHKLAGMVKARGLERKKTESGMRWRMTPGAYAYLVDKFGVGGVNQLGRVAAALKKEALSKGKALRAV
jgi:predicted P-loop ATPase